MVNSKPPQYTSPLLLLRLPTDCTQANLCVEESLVFHFRNAVIGLKFVALIPGLVGPVVLTTLLVHLFTVE
jgi:hypothetical protein